MKSNQKLFALLLMTAALLWVLGACGAGDSSSSDVEDLDGGDDDDDQNAGNDGNFGDDDDDVPGDNPDDPSDPGDDDDNPGDDDFDPPLMANLQLNLIDAPVDDAEAVYVTISQIRLHYLGEWPPPPGDDDDTAPADDDDTAPADDDDTAPADDDDTAPADDDDTAPADDDDTAPVPDNGPPFGDDDDTAGPPFGDDDTFPGDDDTWGDDDTAPGDDDTAGDDDDDEEEGTWIDLDFEPTEYNLLELQNNVSAMLADQELPAGDYSQMRLTLDCSAGNNPSIVIDGVEHDLFIPSGCESGIKLTTPFDLEAEQDNELIIDFDVRKSVHQTGAGQYMMRPTVRLVDADEVGVIAGTVTPVEIGAVAYALEPGTYTPGNYEDAVNSAMADETGYFALAALPAGSYHVVIEADSYQTVVIEGVEVTAEGETILDPVEMAQ